MLLIFTKYKIFPSKIGATVMVVTPLLLYFLVIIIYESARLRIFRAFESFLIFAIVCITVGLMAFCYLHCMWVKPSRHLLLGVQLVTAHFVR